MPVDQFVPESKKGHKILDNLWYLVNFVRVV